MPRMVIQCRSIIGERRLTACVSAFDSKMNSNGHTFLDKVLKIVKDEQDESKPLIKFKSPKELEEILDLDVTRGVGDEELETCVRKVLEFSVKTGKAKFKNQLFGGMDPYGLSGAWISEAFNTGQYTFEVAPAFTLIELKMIQHTLRLFGMPEGDGIFSPGGSLAIMYGVVAARYKAFPQVKSQGVRSLPELVLFTSEDSHYSMKKAAHWLGFGTDSVKVIKTNDRGQMLVNELDVAIQREKELGKYPLMVNATAGTTVLGAIDDLTAVADVCKKYGVWMHVDACWGGSLMLSTTHRSKLNGIERADSISWNPHKMAGAPLQCSLFLVRWRGLLHESNAAAAQYLFQQDKYYDVSYDTGDKSVQCGRKTDSFKLWMMWKARGDSGLCTLTDYTMEMAQACLDLVKSIFAFRPVFEDLQCPNVCFWYIPKFMRNKTEDDEWWELIHKITAKIKELLVLSGRMMISYSPVRHYKNFFRIAFTFHPVIDDSEVRNMLRAIVIEGEKITLDML